MVRDVLNLILWNVILLKRNEAAIFTNVFAVQCLAFDRMTQLLVIRSSFAKITSGFIPISFLIQSMSHVLRANMLFGVFTWWSRDISISHQKAKHLFYALVSWNGYFKRSIVGWCFVHLCKFHIRIIVKRVIPWQCVLRHDSFNKDQNKKALVKEQSSDSKVNAPTYFHIYSVVLAFYSVSVHLS